MQINVTDSSAARGFTERNFQIIIPKKEISSTDVQLQIIYSMKLNTPQR